ncbi:PREDICTED: kinesin-like protein KIF18A [Polistes dominula]|uniref:Kinesin-like protein KIF18A n=1 Tax=Polistes dominula TaxID=743375 RepID=A0ABM1HUX6_POLDO|nr:PREDICTED: kinesin-like protein KIF18A [Polistes dominula]
MVYNKKDQAKAFSPNKVRKFGKKRLSGNLLKTSANGSGAAASSSTSTSTSTPSSLSSSLVNKNKSETNIKVIVRVRPPNDNELQLNSKTIVNILDDKMLIFDPKEKENPFYYQGVVQKGRDLLKKQNKELQFMFDRIFGDTSTNNDIFEGTTKELILSLLNGYNCSVFAYGATGAGKTHTMLGSANDPGLTYRTVAELFCQIENQSRHNEFNLGVSYLEIYNENVQDLLHKSAQLHLREDSRSAVIVAGLKIIPIQNAEELLSLLAKGNKNRTQHPTDANQESSRSHAVFQVYIQITNKLNGQTRHVKLSMIDLAGSERASVTGCKGARFKEGANINKSLLALGNCINNLADGVKHIPYRDSKLTRLLKDSLGGNCQTVMIANISPSNLNYEDTYNTLRYANRAKKIKTCVKKNIVSCEMYISGYIKIVEEQKKEINFLKQQLAAYESGLVQVQPEIKETKVVTEKIDDSLTEINNKLLELCHKKKLLSDKMLSLESADKILYFRMHYKKVADQRLHNLTAAVDILSSEEQNASGKTRVNKSLDYFKRQRSSLKIQMEGVWKELRTVEEEMQKLNAEIVYKNLRDKLANVYSSTIQELDTCIMQQQYEHVKKIVSLQQCELHSMCTIHKLISPILQSYYNLMNGYGIMTKEMKEEFKQLIKSLEGVRNIKWSDSEMIDEEKDFYSLSCLSIPQLKDPLNHEVPVFVESVINEENHNDQITEDVLSKTFNLNTCEAENTEVLDTTITLHEKNETNSIMNTEQNSIKVINKNGTSTNSAFLQNKVKRLIPSNNKIYSKQFKKTHQKHQILNHVVGSPDKENKNTQKQHSVMSAKSIAILNSLKEDKIKTISCLSTKPSKPILQDAQLKSVRIKERRGLGSTHPYQKSKQK